MRSVSQTLCRFFSMYVRLGYLLKVANFYYYRCMYLATPFGVTPLTLNIIHQECFVCVICLAVFDRSPACGKRTDRQTDTGL